MSLNPFPSLSPDGKVDSKLDPQLDEKDLRLLFKAMLTARRYDERMLRLQRQGRIGTYGPAMGQEAASLGTGLCDVPKRLADSFVPRTGGDALSRLAVGKINALVGRE